MKAFIESIGFKHLTGTGGDYTPSVTDAETENSSSVDLATNNASNLFFMIIADTIAAATTLTAKLQYSSDNTNWTDVTGSTKTWAAADDDKIRGWEIINPQHRYYRAQVSSAGGTSTIAAILAMLGNLRKEPFSQSTAAGHFVDSLTQIIE